MWLEMYYSLLWVSVWCWVEEVEVCVSKMKQQCFLSRSLTNLQMHILSATLPPTYRRHQTVVLTLGWSSHNICLSILGWRVIVNACAIYEGLQTIFSPRGAFFLPPVFISFRSLLLFSHLTSRDATSFQKTAALARLAPLIEPSLRQSHEREWLGQSANNPCSLANEYPTECRRITFL